MCVPVGASENLYMTERRPPPLGEPGRQQLMALGADLACLVASGCGR